MSCATAAAKFTGSGGAIVAFCPEGDEQEERLRAACKKEGFIIEEVEVGDQYFNADSPSGTISQTL